MKAYGSIPNGLWILHKCDNPSCINPNHLYAGTPKQNLEDRKRGPKANGWKGPDHRGEKNTRAKLTLVDVEYIRQNRKYGMGKVLAEKYGVHVQTIRNIWRGALWK